MLDNQTRRELLSKARQSGFPGSILDVFNAYEQGKDLIGEFQQQQQQQQSQQMSDMAAQQSGMMAPGQQPLPQEMPQAPAPPPPGLQGQSLPNPPPPANPNLVDSTQQQPVGMATNAKGSSGGQVLMANGGFVEKFTDDQYNKFSSHFPFSKEQRGSIAHRATVENPDLTMVNPKKYVFGGLKHALGGFKYENGGPYKPYVAENKGPYQADPGYLGNEVSIVRGLKREKYDPVSENIYINSSYDDPLDEEEAINHEKMHHLQKRLGALSTTEKWPGPLKPPSMGATGSQVHDYYNRNIEDLNNIVGALPQASLTGIPRDMLLKGFQKNLYDTPGTAEYEADHPSETIDQWKLNARRENEKAAPSVRFAAGGFEGDPKKKGNIATAADSSYVAAGADAPHNFYKKNGYDAGIVPNTTSGTFFNLGMNEAETNKWETGNVFDRLAIARKNYEKWGKSDSNIDVVTNQPISYNDYTTYKPGAHRFEQRELAIGAMNSKAPRSKYDDRIMPQRMAQYDNWKTGDSATVPVYDKLAVTPWKELSDKQKIKRLQQYGGSGTPYKDKASIKKAIQDLKTPKPVEPPMENPKMIEAKPLPIPTVNIKPQLQNIQPQRPSTQPSPKFLRSTIYTPEGPKVRVADMNQRFVRWEDESGETLDFEKTPSGDWQVDFSPTYQDAVKKSKSLKFATGGKKLLKKRR